MAGDELIIFLERAPEVAALPGELAEVVDRSGGRTLRRVMKRHSLSLYLDRAVRVLTRPPDDPDVAAIDSDGAARLDALMRGAVPLADLPDDIAIFVEAPELIPIEGVVHIVNRTGGRLLRRVMTRPSLRTYVERGLPVLDRPIPPEVANIRG
ncbi:MAG: hypothetical protein QOH04_2618 [Sphingomonadales bacterium]|nr:hypothetical protein [Sphingomonadales bacterium]